MGGPEVLIVTNDVEKGPPSHGKHNQDEQSRSLPPSTYHVRVIGLRLRNRPWLESLHQFMDPNAKGFAINLGMRMSHFDIKVIHISRSGKLDSAIKCTTPGDFESACNYDKERTGTLVIAKGLSRAIIEALGARFELEPEFFANHLAGTELYRTGRQEPLALRPPARSPILLPEYIKKARFYTAEFRRPYHFEGGQEQIVTLRNTKTSTPRGVFPTHKDLPDFFAAEKVSVYKKPGSNVGKRLIQFQRTVRKSNILLIPQASFSPINYFWKSLPHPTSHTQSHCSTMMLRISGLTAAGTKYPRDESSSPGSSV
jgi:hypothetical protein